MEEREIERLFREHYLDMYKLAQYYLYDKEECKDVVSDVFVFIISPQDKDIFRMRFIDEMSYQEMMDVTGISRMAIYKHLSRTINLIKEHLKNKNK